MLRIVCFVANITRCLTHWPLGDLDLILKNWFSILFYWLVSWDLCMIMPSDECHRALLMISQQWFRQWLGVVRQQAITWASVDQDPCRHMVSLCHNELTPHPKIPERSIPSTASVCLSICLISFVSMISHKEFLKSFSNLRGGWLDQG